MKTISDLEEAIFLKLESDTEIVSGATTGSGFHDIVGNNFYAESQPSMQDLFPRVIYDIIDDEDMTNDDQTGQVSTTLVTFVIEDTGNSKVLSNYIDGRIKQVINGNGTLTNDKIVCYSCFRQRMLSQSFVEDVMLWETLVSYEIVWAPRQS